MRRRPVHSLAAALAGLLVGLLPGLLVTPPAAAQDAPKAELALMGTLPLYWGEAAGIEELLAGQSQPHWARAQLERSFHLRPLSALTAEALAGVERLLLAQPRGLSAAENVALDAWVRGGGRLLLFADPMLTGESRFGLGDRRRPQDVILLSPILDHWGLALEFAEDQPAGPQLREIAGRTVPVRLAGRFAAPPPGAGCTLAGAGVLAECAIGAGRATVLADAALLDLHHPPAEAADALALLLGRAFGAGDFAGPPAAARLAGTESADSRSAGPGANVDDPAHNPP